jgi:HPt (histidine-containing phosphotransfer) domain-containing protein
MYQKKLTNCVNSDFVYNIEQLYDLSGLKEIHQNDETFIRIIKDAFISHTPADATKMLNACSAGDWPQVGFLAHKLKSSIDILKIASIKDDIRAIESNARQQKQLTSLPELVQKVNIVIAMTAKQMND